MVFLYEVRLSYNFIGPGKCAIGGLIKTKHTIRNLRVVICGRPKETKMEQEIRFMTSCEKYHPAI